MVKIIQEQIGNKISPVFVYSMHTYYDCVCDCTCSYLYVHVGVLQGSGEVKREGGDGSLVTPVTEPPKHMGENMHVFECLQDFDAVVASQVGTS